ncbi:helix-turn-helix domain-containing protein [Streptomyces sp. NPDC059003]|uniref:helix-turn-helix domain-containing protein n=1 Tax=Streptomyces sp. NPDC059003 TaxID=3346691 RepID=UPI0036BBAF4B
MQTAPHQWPQTDVAVTRQAGHCNERSQPWVTTSACASRLQSLIRGRRKQLNLTQRDLAARLYLSCRAYGNWERNQVTWDDDKLHRLARALEMTALQIKWLFLLAIGRPPHPDMPELGPATLPRDSVTTAFLTDYAAMMDAQAYPTFLINHRWDVVLANRAYRGIFRQARNHPYAMPAQNFLRFGLLHPDARLILPGFAHWQLAMMAQLALSLDTHMHDPALRALLQELLRNPELSRAYTEDMPQWALAGGPDLVQDDAAPRPLRHPDPDIGLTQCRLVGETPRGLQIRGLTRITIVLSGTANQAPACQPAYLAS